LFSLATSSGNELARSHKLKTVYFSLYRFRLVFDSRG